MLTSNTENWEEQEEQERWSWQTEWNCTCQGGGEELSWDCVYLYVHMWGCVHVLVCRCRALPVTGRREVSVPHLLGIY